MADVQALRWRVILQSMLTAEQRSQLERHAPASYQFPSGRRVLLQYEIEKPPILAAPDPGVFWTDQFPQIGWRTCAAGIAPPVSEQSL